MCPEIIVSRKLHSNWTSFKADEDIFYFSTREAFYCVLLFMGIKLKIILHIINSLIKSIL